MEKSILEMARGAITERVDYEMGRVLANILDPNTKAVAKRKITLTVEFIPDDERQTISVSVTAKSTLVPTTPIKTALYASTGSFGDFAVVEMTPQIPGQASFEGEEQEAAPLLRIVQ